MTDLNNENFDKIASQIIEEGEPDDLVKFMLAGQEAALRYFDSLDADMRKDLVLRNNEWYLIKHKNHVKAKSFTGLTFFKIIAPSIIPFVENLIIENTHLTDYSFLNDIKNLDWLCLEFTDDEHIKVLSALSSLQFVNRLTLHLKSVNLQLLKSLPFTFNELIATNVLFEDDPKCDKVFQTTTVHLNGNKQLKNDFVFTRENYQNYAAIFPNASRLNFVFYIKIIDDVSDLLKVSNANHPDEVEVSNQAIEISYQFFDYSGYPDSKVLKMLQDDERWDTEDCPYKDAYIDNYPIEVTCRFPLAGPTIGSRLAEQSLRRIPGEYYRLTIENNWGHKAEFEVFKNATVESLLETYGEITGIDPERLHFEVDGDWISDGLIADNFKDNDVVLIRFD